MPVGTEVDFRRAAVAASLAAKTRACPCDRSGAHYLCKRATLHARQPSPPALVRSHSGVMLSVERAIHLAQGSPRFRLGESGSLRGMRWAVRGLLAPPLRGKLRVGPSAIPSPFVARQPDSNG